MKYEKDSTEYKENNPGWQKLGEISPKIGIVFLVFLNRGVNNYWEKKKEWLAEVALN